MAEFPVVLLEIVAGRSIADKARKVGVAAGPVPGPAKMVLAVWVTSCGASVPLEVMGEPDTVGLKMTPSPAIPTLATVPGLVTPLETNIVRTSVIEEIAVLEVVTVAMGIAALVKPVVFDAGAQLLEGVEIHIVRCTGRKGQRAAGVGLNDIAADGRPGRQIQGQVRSRSGPIARADPLHIFHVHRVERLSSLGLRLLGGKNRRQ